MAHILDSPKFFVCVFPSGSPTLPRLYVAAIDECIRSARQSCDIDALLHRLKDLDSVTKRLREKALALADARHTFDAFLDEYSEARARLTRDGMILFDPVFESAIVKVLEGRRNNLSAEECDSVEELRLQNNEDEGAAGDNLASLAERALKRRRLSQNSTAQ
eukprot:IDg8279t1